MANTASKKQRFARQKRLRQLANRERIVAERAKTQSPELKQTFQEKRYQDNAAAAGVKVVNSQNDLDRIDAYLRDKEGPVSIPPFADGTLPEPEPLPELEPLPEIEMPDFDGLLSELADNFSEQMAAQDQRYMDALAGFQSSIKSATNPLKRNPVLGVRFAGQGNAARANSNNFKRSGDRIAGLKTTAINL